MDLSTRNWNALTVADLRTIAVQSGAMTDQEVRNRVAALHHDELLASELRLRLGDVLWSMFCKGELTLSTRTRRNAPC